MKLKYIDMVGKDKATPRYRRRIPKVCQEALGLEWFQVHLSNKSGAKMLLEYETITRQFDKLIDDTRKRLVGDDTRSPAARWRDAVLKAEGMLDEITGLDRQEARGILAEGLRVQGEAPLVIKATLNPSAEPPKATLQDARNIYEQERVKGDRNKAVRIQRHVTRMEAALGPLKKLALVSLKREHGRKVRDYLLNEYRKDNGLPLSVESVSRELSIMSAMVTLGIRELDLEGQAINPFTNLELPKSKGRKSDKRHPLPDDLVFAMKDKLLGLRHSNPALHLTWRLMTGTSAHAKELAYLEVRDVDLDREVVCIRPNSLRGDLKTGARDRDIPLVGDALSAAREAVALAGVAAPTAPLFPRYARHDRSHDALSTILGDHLEKIRANPKQKVYGLRHRVAAKLRLAGAEQVVIDRVLGHAIEAEGASVYGGSLDRIEVDRKWLEKAAVASKN